jgi:hypothetical protein
MPTLTDQQITDALLAGNGLLTDAARDLSKHLGRPVSRAMVASRVEASRVLRAVQQIAEERSFERVLASAQERRRERRSASMKASWVERKAQAGVVEGCEDAGNVDGPNVRARTRGSRDITPATVQAARDQRLCGAKTRKGTPCVRRVVPGRNRCPNHGGLTTGPKTVEGKARIAAAARARWERYRQERAIRKPDNPSRPRDIVAALAVT